MNDERIEKIVREMAYQLRHKLPFQAPLERSRLGLHVAAEQIEKLIEPLSEVVRQAHAEAIVGDDQIKHMVNRFLQWRLPENFNPDGGISFKKTYNEHAPWGPMRHEPVGTNLLDAIQAEEMIRYITAELPPTNPTLARIEAELRTAEAVLAELNEWERARKLEPLTDPVTWRINRLADLHASVATLRRERDAEKANG